MEDKLTKEEIELFTEYLLSLTEEEIKELFDIFTKKII